MIRVIGIGSPFGDDAAGLEAARQLAAAPPPGTEIVAADRPGATLIDLLGGVDAVVLIDAAHSGAPPGTLHDLDLYELPHRNVGLVSSHSLGVSDAVQLARMLGHAPTHGRILAIETASMSPTFDQGRLCTQSGNRGVHHAQKLIPQTPFSWEEKGAGSQTISFASSPSLSKRGGQGVSSTVRGRMRLCVQSHQGLSPTTRAAVAQVIERTRQWCATYTP